MALGGTTWRPQAQPPAAPLGPLQRVTRQGWVSVICLLVALGLGILKETLIDSRASEVARRESELNEQVAALRALADSTDQTLKATNEELAIARSELQRQSEEMIRAKKARKDAEAAQRRAEELAFAPVRANILWAVNGAGRGSYDKARRNGKSRYEAALYAQRHDGGCRRRSKLMEL